MPRGNTRHSVFVAPYPIYCARGAGSRVWDVDGVERLDFVNNYSALIHGHGSPQVLRAMESQASRLIAVGMPTEVEIGLAELLCERIESVEQIRFTNSGTEAVMMAVKAARAFTGKPAVAKFEGCYHGTYDFVEISQAPGESAWGPDGSPASVALSVGTPAEVAESTVVLPFNDVGATARILSERKKDLAAIIVDAAPSHLGYLPVSGEIFKLLREFADAERALLILDEVYSLRLDAGGAQRRLGVKPDLTVMGKIIGGGLPVGAVGGRAEIMAVFDPLPTRAAVAHGGTFNANPLTMAAGEASMRAYTEKEVARLEELGTYARTQLQHIAKTRGLPIIVGGLGSLISITFSATPLRNYRDRARLASHKHQILSLYRGMLDRGIFIAPHGLIVLSTAMERNDIDHLLTAFDATLADLK
ncbi:MAG TPA: aspartate aminotransferase family protein [Steroidobacteraceae bacterium]|nr:aspartate aminotransferase family protein [Steroidobacteraceae bacterium]